MLEPFPSLAHRVTLPLKHNGDCNLLGSTPDLTLYAEEIYGDNAWVAQHQLRLDGTFVESVDEAAGANADLQPLDLPPELVRPKTGWQTMELNFAGARHRGLRESERILDLVRTLSIEEKFALIQKLDLNVAPPLLLGIAESYVLAESIIVRPNLYFVCRRIRLAVALTERRMDEDQQPYDYETYVFYLAHFYDRMQEPKITDLLTDLVSQPLYRPMDCLLVNDHLLIADGGADDRPSAIHVWQIELPEVLTEEQKLHKKIYG